MTYTDERLGVQNGNAGFLRIIEPTYVDISPADSVSPQVSTESRAFPPHESRHRRPVQ